MFNRIQVCAALLICTLAAFAQEASTPSLNTTGGQTGGGSLFVPSSAPSMDIPVNGLGTPFQSGTDSSVTPEQKPKPTPENEGFSIPGGFGFAPMDFTPGQGKFDRKPLSFSTTIQQAYDDNTNSSSGSLLQPPIKGSMLTHFSQGVDVLISQSRLGLSLDANGGGQYYWTKTNTGDQLTPNAGLDFLFAYKLTPQAQFSATVNSSYTTQPSLSVINGLTQSSNKGYFLTNIKLDLLYRWTPRFATDTTYTVNSDYSQDSASQNNNYLNQTVGESLRYTFSRLMTGVLEGRVSQNTFNSSTYNSNTYFTLVGADFTITRRLMGMFRAGETTQSYQTASSNTASLPYFETSLNYNLTKMSSLSLNGRYGFDSTNSNGETTKSLRTGLSFTQALSSKLSATAGVTYSHSDYSQVNLLGGSTPVTDEAISSSVGLQYILSQHMSLFSNINRLTSTPADRTLKYAKDTYYFGLTYQY